jgi:hypothetical protein
MKKPPSTLDEAWPTFEPHQATIRYCWMQAHRQAVAAFHGRPGLENRTLKGAYVDWAVEAARIAFAPLEERGEAYWVNLDGLRLLCLGPGAMLWFKTVDDDCVPRKNSTYQAFNVWSQQMQIHQPMLPFDGQGKDLEAADDCTIFLAAANVDLTLASDPRIAIAHQVRGFITKRYLDDDGEQISAVIPMVTPPTGGPSKKPRVASDLKVETEEEAGQ